MFAKLFAAVKGWLSKMGLIQTINNVTQFSAVIESQWQYERILMWRALYRGYLAKYNGVPFHDGSYVDVTGKKHERHRATLMMPKMAAEKMASLVFNEKCKINIGAVKSSATAMSDNENQDTANQSPINIFSDNIMGVLKANDFYKQFQRWLECMFSRVEWLSSPM